MRDRRRRRPLVSFLALSIVAVLVLLIAEFSVYLILPRLKNPAIGLQGLYVQDISTGYRLARNWSGFYDDGEVRCSIRTNSLGDRDDEPTPADSVGLLLLGDSYAFGFLLDQEETIDRQIERLSNGETRAYNLGVPGYGPPAIRERLRDCDRFRGTDVVYLFFNNDLRSDNLEPDMGLTVYDGFLVPKRRSGGSPYSDPEYRRIIAEIVSRPTGNDLESFLKLRNLRRAVNLFYLQERIRRLWDPQRSLLGTWPGTEFHPENAAAAAEITAEMERMAASRGQRFHVVIVPSAGEVRAGRHARLSEQYIALLRSQGIESAVMLDRLSPDDYYPHNMHLNRRGAAIVAKAVLEATGNRPSPTAPE